jgi:hypothetical protein
MIVVLAPAPLIVMSASTSSWLPMVYVPAGTMINPSSGGLLIASRSVQSPVGSGSHVSARWSDVVFTVTEALAADGRASSRTATTAPASLTIYASLRAGRGGSFVVCEPNVKPDRLVSASRVPRTCGRP